MSYRTEFPTFPVSAIPAELLASDWTDTSWHNDACPSFERGRFTVFVDWPRKEDRWTCSALRYHAYPTEEANVAEFDNGCESDDWADILRYLATEGY